MLTRLMLAGPVDQARPIDLEHRREGLADGVAWRVGAID